MPEDSHISTQGSMPPSVARWDNVGSPAAATVSLRLSAVIVAVRDGEPLVLTDRADGVSSLPSGPFPTLAHGPLEAGLRAWTREQAGLTLGHSEQLSTFAESARGVSVGYLALAGSGNPAKEKSFHWQSWYSFLPWEDWRKGRPDVIARRIQPRLAVWARAANSEDDAGGAQLSRADRVRVAFGLDGMRWDEERTLERYMLLCDAGLIGETYQLSTGRMPDAAPLAEMLRAEHSCIVAMAIDRLRAKIKHRPIVFELMGPEFTLFELQKTVEAVLGSNLHKQNFRRLVESVGLVEATGDVRSHTGGRPAKLYRFRREVLLENPAPGLRVHAGR